jgi:hypothetical protein
MPISGSSETKNPLAPKGFLHVWNYRLCRILCKADESAFSASEEAWQLHKKGAFYAIFF